MLSKLDRSKYRDLKDTARDLISSYPLINAVVSGVQEGQVYTDNCNPSFFIATRAGFACSNAPHTDDAAFFEFLRTNHDIPSYIHVYAPTKSFADHVASNWEKFRLRRRAQFRSNQKEATYHYETLLPAGYRVASIQMIEGGQLENSFKLDFGRRYWNSWEDFKACSLGVCILDVKGEPIAISYSACVVDGIAELDTMVTEEHRGKGFMRIVSEPFLNMLYAKGLNPHWDTFVANKPSYVLAQKLGLDEVQEYNLLSILLR